MRQMNWAMGARLMAALPLALCVLDGVARPINATGACPLASLLVQADHRTGVASNGSAAEPRLEAEIRPRAAELPPWFADEGMSTSSFRLYQAAGRGDVVVLTRCNRTNCDAERAYIGFAPRSGEWGASIYLHGRVTELGRPILPGAALQIMPEDVAPAVLCAEDRDWGN